MHDRVHPPSAFVCHLGCAAAAAAAAVYAAAAAAAAAAATVRLCVRWWGWGLRGRYSFLYYYGVAPHARSCTHTAWSNTTNTYSFGSLPPRIVLHGDTHICWYR